jgi:ABC-type nitrate/sulfonate/bicarbonate transport system substrate-binding protein
MIFTLARSSLVCLLMLFWIPAAAATPPDTVQNVLILGAGGTSYSALARALSAGSAPAIKSLAAAGSVVKLHCNQCLYLPGSEWNQVLSGNNAGALNAPQNGNILIPPGMSVFSRVQGGLGHDGVFTFAISAQISSAPLAQADYRPRSQSELFTALDAALRGAAGKRFFGFIDCSDPAGLPGADRLSGKILTRLSKERSVGRTLIYFVGFAEQQAGFMVSNFPNLRVEGSYRDVSPTALDLMGVNWRSLVPKVNGDSIALLREEIHVSTATETGELRLGYFFGVRTAVIFRTLVSGAFDREGLKVSLMSKYLRAGKYYPIPRDYAEIAGLRKARFGKADGTELLEQVAAGRFMGATVGETAFLLAVGQGLPVVAVAELAHDVEGGPSRCLLLRKGVSAVSPRDLKGRVFGSKRSAGGDTAFLKEFFLRAGMDPQRDVSIVENINDDKLKKKLSNGKIDGGLFHFSIAKQMVDAGIGWIYSPMNWIDPHMNQSLLVFRKDFVESSPEIVRKVVLAYMKQNAMEWRLPEAQRLKSAGLKGLEIDSADFEGTRLPRCELVPLVRQDVLEGMQALLVRQKTLPKAADLGQFINNNFVKASALEIGSPGEHETEVKSLR